MFATVCVERKVSGVSKSGKEYNIINFVVCDCKSAPFLAGQRFGLFVKDPEHSWEWSHLVEQSQYECDLQLYSNKAEYANLHFSVSTCGYKPLSVSNE